MGGVMIKGKWQDDWGTTALNVGTGTQVRLHKSNDIGQGGNFGDVQHDCQYATGDCTIWEPEC